MSNFIRKNNLPSGEDIYLYSKNDEPIVISKPLMDLILNQENPSDLLSLYAFYYYTAKWQGTNHPKASDRYCMNALQWGYVKLHNAKKALLDLGLIKRICKKDEQGQILGWFIKVMFIWREETFAQNSYYPVLDESISGFRRRNALSSNKEMLSDQQDKPVDNKLNAKESEVFLFNDYSDQSEMPITQSMFDKFWKLYPKKVDKGKAQTSWNKICSKPAKQRPTFHLIIKAVLSQKKSERWQNAVFIPHPTTWLNQSRWLDDPKEMKSYNRSQEDTVQCSFGFDFGKSFSYNKVGCQRCEDDYNKIWRKCKLLFDKL